MFICYVVTEIQGTSVYKRESWRPEPILSSTLTRQHARFRFIGNFARSRKDHFSKDHFTIDQSDCMICNTVLRFVNRRAILLKSDLEMNQHQWTWTCASCRSRVYGAHYHCPIRLHHLQHCDSSVLERKWSCKTTSLIPRRPLIFVFRFAFFSYTWRASLLVRGSLSSPNSMWWHHNL